MATDTETLDAKARQIRLLALDVDGVLTDGRLYLGGNGEELKAFNTLDGHGIKLLQQSGVKVGIITGRKSALVARRAAELGIDLLLQDRLDKLNALKEMLTEVELDLSQVAFMGDDLPDLAPMCRVGLALTVPNAHPVVRQHAHWQSARNGGEGAVREACDWLMQAQDTFDAVIARYLNPTS